MAVSTIDALYNGTSEKLTTSATGITVTGNATFADNGKAIFGAGDDLQIYHDGGNSYIQDTGTGDLFVDGNTNLVIRDQFGGSVKAKFITSGANEFYYAGSQKLATTSTGVDVTGTVTGSTGITTGVNYGNFTPITSGTTGARINANANGMLRLASGGVDKMYVLDSGNVGIGDSNPLSILHVGTGASANVPITFAPSSGGNIEFRNTSSTGTFTITNGNGSSENLRIDSSGNLLVGQTTETANAGKLQISGRNGHHCATFRNGNDGGYGLVFRRVDNTAVGTITWSGSATSYNTSSDYRLKENVVDLTGASARVNQLDVKRFNFIADETNTLVDGFLAHEVATVVPEAITGAKDAMMDEEYEVTPATGDIYTPATEAYVDGDGNDVDAVDEVIHSADAEQPETLEDGQQWRETTAAVMGTQSVPDYQGIDQSKLVPLLTAALQEALTEIASLKTRVEALEA